MELQQIVAKHEGKCFKCKRDIRAGWTVYYDAVQKVAYCKPCYQTMQQQTLTRQPANTPDSFNGEAELLLNELAGNIKLYNEMMAAFSLSLKGINESLEEIKKLLKAKTKEK